MTRAAGKATSLDDLRVGQRFVSGSHRVRAADIVRFARQFDPQVSHTDREAAKLTVFEGLAASGWHTAGITMKLLVDARIPIPGTLLGLGGDIRWLRPVRAGDALKAYSEVVSVRPSKSRPGRGVLTLRTETRNQHGDVVQIFQGTIMGPWRAPARGVESTKATRTTRTSPQR